jgi:hypothetical protein
MLSRRHAVGDHGERLTMRRRSRRLDSNGDTILAGMELSGLDAAARSDLRRSFVPPPSREGGGPGPWGGSGPGARR